MSVRSPMTDHDLLQAFVQRCDTAALGSFLGRHQDSVLRFVTQLLGDPHIAQDIVQETFLRAARHPTRLLQVESCHNWLLRVARNLGMDHLRRVSRQHRHTARLAERVARSTEAAPEHEARVEDAEIRERLHAAVVALSPRQRELVLLRIQEGKSYLEIAEITGLSATHVGLILHQAMKALTKSLRGVGQ
ncbi:MAG: RNA polymerase sigma factor [Planctomycetota bacterium]